MCAIVMVMVHDGVTLMCTVKTVTTINTYECVSLA